MALKIQLPLSLSSTIDKLQERVLRLLEITPPERRIIIALSGVPGSGKSTIVAGLLANLSHAGMRDVAVAPMDGYHYSKASLALFEDPELAFLRRGAPFTYDVDAFLDAVSLLRCTPVAAHDAPTRDIWMPGFDHAVQDPVANQICIPATTRVVILEGNYVLLDLAPWNHIADIADERWFVDTSRDVAKQRIAKRHLMAKIEPTLQAAESRAETNDLPNGDYIRERLVMPEVVVKND